MKDPHKREEFSRRKISSPSSETVLERGGEERTPHEFPPFTNYIDDVCVCVSYERSEERGEKRKRREERGERREERGKKRREERNKWYT